MKTKKRSIGSSNNSVKKRLIKGLKLTGIVLSTLALMTIVYHAERGGVWFKASILEAPQPFNGTALPVSKVPNWQYWNSQKNLRYNQLNTNDLIDLPKYDLGKLQFPMDQLVWGDSSQDSIRNAKMTYPVVYMGNYKYDHKENVGSHLAVDIKIPEGTPVHSIANGKVIKVSKITTGFGHHVVVKHPNVPDPENPGQSTTLYSAFNHMDEIQVVEGQNVLKGQVIGTSGNTGTSTTPHLHFQIDRDSADWHPYWPFSWQESQDAGLSFFEAVNAGLGKSNGENHTINPMKFIYAHLNSNALATNNENSSPANNENNETPEVIENTNENTTETPVETNPVETTPIAETEVINIPEPEEVMTVNETNSSALFTYQIVGESVSLINNGVTLTVVDELGQINQLNDEDEIKVEISGVGSLLKKEFKKSDFNNKAIKVVVRSSDVGVTNIRIGKSSYQIQFIDSIKSIYKFHVEHDGHFQKNIVEMIKVIAIDEDGNVAPTANFTGAASLSTTQGSARFIPNSLESKDFKNGIAEVKMISSSEEPVKIKAQNGAIVGNSERISMEEGMVFTDISQGHKNYQAIKYLKEKDILSGYSDGSFKPNQVVNRVEALKMLMLAFNVNVGGGSTISFNDTEANAWYASTLSTAVQKEIVKGYADGTFKPANSVNRAEYLKILFKTNDNIKTDIEITKPYDDVETNVWFAKYAFLANKMNLIDPTSKLKPDQFMTRAEVAETIYRMRVIQDGNLLTYKK